jgi:hypothetical protein
MRRETIEKLFFSHYVKGNNENRGAKDKLSFAYRAPATTYIYQNHLFGAITAFFQRRA